jgi:serine 3-dehydrogenase (NADP+)
MSQPLTDRVAIIVGSSSGMGRATAMTFAEAGAKVVLAARRAEVLQVLADEIGENAIACPTDVQDASAVERLIQTTLDHFGRIDVLVYATGTNIKERSLEVLSNETWQMMLQTNLTGAFYCTKAVLPTMRRQKSGLIIYLSTAAAKFADVSGVSYQASKHGMTGLAHGTFKEERDNGIRTSIIFPGLTDTPLVLKRPVPTPTEVVAKALQPQDVADACLFVASLPPRACVPELLLMPTELA